MGTLTDEEIEEYKRLKESREKQYKRQKKYLKSRERSYVVFPDGTKDRIKNLTDESINAFINRLVMAELDRLENKSTQEPIDTDKYNDMPTLAPMPKPQPVMSSEEEVKALQELQKRIDERNGNTSRINEKPSESVLIDVGEEMDTTDCKTAQNGNMESVGEILDGFMNPPETDWLSESEQGIYKRLKQQAIDDGQFELLTEEKIEATIETYGKDLVNNEKLIEQIIESHGQTNYERIVAEMKHRRMLR